MNKLHVSIVILNWNGQRYLEKFLPSVVAYSQLPDVEIVVADNGSTDNSITFLQQNYPTVRIILLDKNYGFAEGYNRAMQQVESDYTLMLNSDVEVTPNWLQPLIHELDNNSQCVACMPKLRAYNQKTHFEYAGAAGGFIDVLGFPFCRGRILSVLEPDEGQYDTPSEIFWATGACFMIRTDVFKSAGGFDGDFFAHMEEIDLCWRLRNMGYSIRYVPQSIAYHVGGGTLPNENPFKLFLNFRNNLFLLYKNLPTNVLIPTIFTRMLLDGAAGIVYALRGQWRNTKAVLKAHRGFYSGLSKYSKKRKQLRNNLKTRRNSPLLRHSIVLLFYLGRKKFSQLGFDFAKKLPNKQQTI